jgi:5'/3'-nucleotidase SurE
MTARRIVLHVVAVLIASALGSSAAVGQPLDVLLTNADGYDADGTRVLREALDAAGHSVTIVAPLDDQRGSGTSITTSGTIDYYRQEEGVWAVDGTPSDAVTLALVHLMRTSPPDVVISGAGIGQSVGAGVLVSGAVGAAMTAARAGVPAIALSVAIAPEADPTSTAASGEALTNAAGLLVEIVRQLAETGGSGLLPARTILNVNYPAVGAGEPAGVRFATVSSQRGFRQLYSVAGDTGPARVEVVPVEAARAEEGSDLALVAEGFVTISVLDGNWDAGRASWQPLLERLIIER